ncbi:MAG: hypothetical protein ACK4MM_04625, partial [Fervidobacterium sp.]
MFSCVPGFARWFHYFGPYGSSWSTFGYIMFLVRPIISFGLFILAIYIIYKLFFSQKFSFGSRNRNIEILKERF